MHQILSLAARQMAYLSMFYAWRIGVSNPSGPACKASLHTCASPEPKGTLYCSVSLSSSPNEHPNTVPRAIPRAMGAISMASQDPSSRMTAPLSRCQPRRAVSSAVYEPLETQTYAV